VLNLNVEVEDIAKQGFALISILAKNNEKNVVGFGRAGACEAIVKGLSLHMTSAAVVDVCDRRYKDTVITRR